MLGPTNKIEIEKTQLFRENYTGRANLTELLLLVLAGKRNFQALVGMKGNNQSTNR
jgi:hypothetical protein